MIYCRVDNKLNKYRFFKSSRWASSGDLSKTMWMHLTLLNWTLKMNEILENNETKMNLVESSSKNVCFCGKAGKRLQWRAPIYTNILGLVTTRCEIPDGSQRLTSDFFLFSSPPYSVRVLQWTCFDNTGWPTSTEDLPVSTPPPPALGFPACATTPSFYTGSRDPNTSHHFCPTSPLPTELIPQPYFCGFFFKWL